MHLIFILKNYLFKENKLQNRVCALLLEVLQTLKKLLVKKSQNEITFGLNACLWKPEAGHDPKIQ